MKKLAIIITILAVSGCGTTLRYTHNIEHKKCHPNNNYIYGGVTADLALMCSAVQQENPLKMLFIPVIALDLPLSAVADTVLLPVSIPKQKKIEKECECAGTPI
ncbi:YceK/YidQ family lipoprotein [Microbulbifer sp. YPW1]|uniref:YceK/YidQ family lipoprotein n=1 Tax=Microbulbifer sp. YPW1 TaxID=2745199 RepID=UPI001598226B|nr:YceK/YidQ family lipoprotein [Microbulbifer sp. YPW1]QKX17646.1 YceK/YidQ family lipoprotein [Microbulbifer sp. YPW1]